MKMRTLILTAAAAATAAVLATAGSGAQAETALSFVTYQTNLSAFD